MWRLLLDSICLHPIGGRLPRDIYPAALLHRHAVTAACAPSWLSVDSMRIGLRQHLLETDRHCALIGNNWV